MHAGQVAVGEHHVGDRDAVAGQHVDHAVGQAGGLEQSHQLVGGELLVGAGFQTTVLPIRAGAGRLPAMAVKLNGVTA